MQRVVVISHRRSGTTYRSHLHTSRKEKKRTNTLKIRPIGCPETSVRNYNYLLRYNPEEFSCQCLAYSCMIILWQRDLHL